MHSSLGSGFQPRISHTSRPLFQLIQQGIERQFATSRHGRFRATRALLHTSSAHVSAATADVQRSEAQESPKKFAHNLSVEQAAAALAGDGHLSYIEACSLLHEPIAC